MYMYVRSMQPASMTMAPEGVHGPGTGTCNVKRSTCSSTRTCTYMPLAVCTVSTISE